MRWLYCTPVAGSLERLSPSRKPDLPAGSSVRQDFKGGGCVNQLARCACRERPVLGTLENTRFFAEVLYHNTGVVNVIRRVSVCGVVISLR